jgi:hypothetical protein
MMGFSQHSASEQIEEKLTKKFARRIRQIRTVFFFLVQLEPSLKLPMAVRESTFKFRRNVQLLVLILHHFTVASQSCML